MKDEGWRMKDEGWRMKWGFANGQTDIGDFRVAFAIEKIGLNWNFQNFFSCEATLNDLKLFGLWI